MRQTYYECRVRLIPPTSVQNAALDKRAKPPHVDFANLGYDPERPRNGASDKKVRQFIQMYGPLKRMRRSMPSDDFAALQDEFRRAWDARDARYFTEPHDVFPYLAMDELRVTWKATPDALELHPVSLIAYLGLLLARDLAEGRARKCQKPGCNTPYFVAGRSDQRYCGHDCAVAVNNVAYRPRRQKLAKTKKKNKRRKGARKP